MCLEFPFGPLNLVKRHNLVKLTNFLGISVLVVGIPTTGTQRVKEAGLTPAEKFFELLLY